MSFTLVFLIICLQNIWCYNLSIIHFNDFHARYEPVNNISATCQGHSCIGGFSRLYSTIQFMLKERPYSVLLNAGDNFQGTLWHTVHKWNVTQHFLNKLPFDAITLGNHEFDNGIEGLVPFLTHIKAPVVVSNINDSLEFRIHNLHKKSITVQRNNKQIGIIGVLTKTTKEVSVSENLIFEDESSCVNAEAAKLEKEGVFTNIVLSHCGYEADLEIARKSTSKISVIVGGHTDTFLYTGIPTPGPDKPLGSYPTVVQNELGQPVLVVQASAHSKYLGNLTVLYDDFGNVTKWEGNPIFLKTEIPTDPEIDEELENWKETVDIEGRKVVGNTQEAMPNKACRSEECFLGNFATDAMLSMYTHEASAAMFHAGGMRAGIEKGDITFNQLISTFPFQDTINLCEIKGEHIKKILESSVDNNHLKWPHLFQLSGMKVIFNVSQPEGHRVASLKIKCKDCSEMDYEDVNVEKNYKILLPTFLTDSGFNPLFKKYIRTKEIGDLDSNVYVKHLKENFPLYPKVEGRIQITK